MCFHFFPLLTLFITCNHPIYVFYRVTTNLCFFNVPMPSNIGNEQRNARRRLLYGHNKDHLNTQRRLRRQSIHPTITSATTPSHSPPLIQNAPPIHTFSTPPPPPSSSTTPLIDAQRCFRKRLDRLHPIQIFPNCQESYPGIKTKLVHGNYTCSRCTRECHGHRFSLENNMDLDTSQSCLHV